MNSSGAESSIARALEAEDKARFGSESNAKQNELRAIQEKMLRKLSAEKASNKVSHAKKEHTKKAAEKHGKGEKLRRIVRSGKLDSRRQTLMRKCHSDSELDSVFREAKQRIERRAKQRNNIISGARYKDTKESSSSRMVASSQLISKDCGIEKKRTNALKERDSESKTIEHEMQRARSKQQKDSDLQHNSKQRNARGENTNGNGSYRSHVHRLQPQQHHEQSCDVEDCSHGKVVSLLLEYFKELTREVCEFREEKGKMREQICSLEASLGKATLAFEALKGDVKKLEQKMSSAKGGNNEACCHGAKHDLQEEVRRMLDDVHKKYNHQLIEHELRMKFVQQRAEYDIQNLMKNIVGNYVELSELKGKARDVGSIVGKKVDPVGRINLKKMLDDGVKSFKNDLPPALQMSSRPLVVDDTKVTTPATRLGVGTVTIDQAERQAIGADKQTKSQDDKVNKQDKQQLGGNGNISKHAGGKYEFYFSKPDRTGKNENTPSSNHKIQDGGKLEQLLDKSRELASLSFGEGQCANVRDSPHTVATGITNNIPDKASAYMAWKESLREKLTQRPGAGGGHKISSDKDQRNIC
eukprot:gene16657-18347_t